MARNPQLVGAAGVHFVAAAMNFHGLHAAPTIRNVPGVDLIVSNVEGRKSAAIQVKTAAWASRKPRKADPKKLDRYEWDNHYVEKYAPSLFYAFVDLKEFQSLPDIFIIPSRVVYKYYGGGNRKKEDWPRPRFHVDEEYLEPYRNAFDRLVIFLGK